MKIDSFIPQAEDNDRSNRTSVAFSWEDLVKTLGLDFNVQYIELNKWGIFFCKDKDKK
jgi:hypothetical protein